MAEDRPITTGPVHLTLMMGPQMAVPVAQEVADALLSVQVTVASGQRSGFQLAFDLAKHGLINTTLLPGGYFDPKTRVILTVTIQGTPTVLMDGVIIRQEVGISNQPGQSTLTVTGEDLTVLMDLEERAAVPFPAMSPAARVAAIIAQYAQYGITPLVIPELIPQTPMPTQRIDFQKGTDLSYVNDLAKANGYVFYLDPGPTPGISRAFWGPEVRLGEPQHALNVNMDGLSNVDQLTFAFDGTAREQPEARIQFPTTRVSAILPVPELSILRPQLAQRPAPALKKKVIADTAKKDAAQAFAETLAKVEESADAVTGSGQLDVVRYGYVLRPRELVGVRGAGITYDGRYFVKSVTHNLQRGSYTQNFTLAREGLIALEPTVVP
jgi:phage protein D